MSRSNPTSSVKNPAVRWVEWNGQQGHFRYYDKDLSKNVVMDPSESVFLFLDRAGAVTGFSDKYQSNIYSNQIRSSKKQQFEVSTFNKKDGPIAKGFWKDIKELVSAKGGKFTANIYVGLKVNGELSVAVVQFKGAALSAWSEFEKSAGDMINSKAIRLDGTKEGKKGSVTYFTPEFKLIDVSEETNKEAIELDKNLQEYLKVATSTDNAEPSGQEEDAGDPVTIEEKKTLTLSSPNFPAIMQNITNGESSLEDVLAKYDMDEQTKGILVTTASNAVSEPASSGVDLDEEDDDIPF